MLIQIVTWHQDVYKLGVMEKLSNNSVLFKIPAIQVTNLNVVIPVKPAYGIYAYIVPNNFCSIPVSGG